MKCKSCGCEAIEFTRLEEIGMNSTDLLLERCEQQQDHIKELEKKCAELQEQWSLERWRKHKLVSLVHKLEELREEMFEAEFLSLEQMHKEKEEENKENQ